MKYLVLSVAAGFFLFLFALAGWQTTLVFLGFLAAMIVGGLIVKRITGAHAWYLEAWTYEPGEAVVWQDERADVFVIAKTGQAVYMSFPRLHLSTVVVTNRRILVAQNPLFGKKHVVRYVFTQGPSPDGQTAHVGGGLLTVGYESIAYEPRAVTLNSEGKYARLELTPSGSEASSLNLSKLYIYTDQAATFPLPA